MKDVIIIGTGKGALLHYNSYKRISYPVNVYFVDIKEKSDLIDNKIYPSIDKCIEELNLSKDNIIIDICTQKSEFLNILDMCQSLNIKDILVEKPFVVNEKIESKYNNLNIVMVENYLYSKVTTCIKNYLDEEKKNISLIYTNFSKNRISDSTNKRGYKDKVTLNYEIEMPHQIYLTNYFLNNKEITNTLTESIDMITENMTLKNHGYGLIISKYKNTNIIYESNLTSDIVQKKVIIETTDNYTVEGSYAVYTKNLKLVEKANVKLFYEGKLINKITIDEDDNFTYFIQASYNYFNHTGNNPDIVSIRDFSKYMKLYCDNLIKQNK